MAKETSQRYGSVTAIGLLQIAFIVLKLCNVIDCKWVWVLAPTWIITVGVLAVLLAAIALEIADRIGAWRRQRKIAKRLNKNP